jgi:DNA adenine methylase
MVTKTKKFDKFPSPFDSKLTVYDAFYRLFRKFRKSTIVASYSSNSLPTLDEMVLLMRMHKSHVTISEAKHRYSFGTQRGDLEYNKVKEYLFIGTD